jgi:very-short-patch-repair endonuclease
MIMDYSREFKQSIYLAGKITAHGWRDAIVGWRRAEDALSSDLDEGQGIDWACCNSELPASWSLRIGEHYDITGPFFVGCDHSCTHGQSTHATAGGCIQPHRGTARDGVRQLCLDAIDRSDVVFAWLDDYTAHGTIGEIAWAHRAEKHIVLAVPPCPTENVYGWGLVGGHQGEITCDCIIHGEQWFVAGMANHIIEATDATTAWNQWMGPKIQHRLETIRSLEEADRFYAATNALRSGQNEVELMFYDAWNSQGSAPEWNLTPQYELTVNGQKYRLDFADDSRKLCIEIDGLAYHNGQEAFMRDRSRERDLLMDGWKVLRFAAKEVMIDADKCVRQAVDWAENV